MRKNKQAPWIGQYIGRPKKFSYPDKAADKVVRIHSETKEQVRLLLRQLRKKGIRCLSRDHRACWPKHPNTDFLVPPHFSSLLACAVEVLKRGIR